MTGWSREASGVREARDRESGAARRRLPVYLRVDEAVGGKAQAQAFERRLERLTGTCPLLVRVILFGREQRIVSDQDDTAPAQSSLEAKALGGALEVLNRSLGEETRAPGSAGPVDHPPLVFLLGTRVPDDDWEPAAQGLRLHAELGFINVLGFAFTEEAARVFARLTPKVFVTAAGREAVIPCLDWIERTVAATGRLAGRAASKRKLVRAPRLPAEFRRLDA